VSRLPKYDPLREHLAAALGRGQHAVDMDFDQIADLVGGLPATAYNLRQWWANDSKVEAQAWRAAGWHVDTVSLDRRRVRFLPGEVGGTYAARRRTASNRRD
jgi:hypothetical protein